MSSPTPPPNPFGNKSYPMISLALHASLYKVCLFLFLFSRFIGGSQAKVCLVTSQPVSTANGANAAERAARARVEIEILERA